jgi:hypothetical protein
MVKKFQRFFALCIATWILCIAAFAEIGGLEHMPVERLDLQAKLLHTVIRFSTQAPEQLVVAIVHTSETRKIAQDLRDELQRLEYKQHPVQVTLTLSDDLEALNSAVNVVYVTPGNAALLETLATLANDRHIFTVTGVPEYVETRKIALGFGEYQRKPQIILCLPAAEMTGHEFKNPKFLNLQTTRKLRIIK